MIYSDKYNTFREVPKVKISRYILISAAIILFIGLGVYVDLSQEKIERFAEPVKERTEYDKEKISEISVPVNEQEGEELRVDPVTRINEDLLPENNACSSDSIARSINMGDENEGSCFDSSDIPPKIREVADQLIEIRDDFDKATLDTVNTALDELPLVEMEADEATLRPSGDGVRLEINIPADTVRKKK